MSNIVTAAFLNSRTAKTRSLWMYDNGMILRVSGIELPEYFEIHFSNAGDATTTLVLGHNNDAEIPNEYFKTGKEINAYIYLHSDGDDGYTLYQATIPVKARPKPNDGEPTKDQEEALDAAIEALNTSAQEAAGSAASAEESAQEAAGSAVLAESWAVGETGTREGEDTNNAKFWALVAQQGAEHSGYAIFNVDDRDGQMYVTITDPLANDVSFLVNENLGTLEVTING